MSLSRKIRRRLPMVAPRKCGECTACCTALAVFEIEKDERADCQHMSRAGCGIYAKRPPSCAEYACAWLRGWGAAEQRPDKLGLIFDLGVGAKDRSMVARECAPGAAQENDALLTHLARAGFMFAFGGGGSTGPITVAVDGFDGSRHCIYPDGRIENEPRRVNVTFKEDTCSQRRFMV